MLTGSDFCHLQLPVATDSAGTPPGRLEKKEVPAEELLGACLVDQRESWSRGVGLLVELSWKSLQVRFGALKLTRMWCRHRTDERRAQSSRPLQTSSCQRKRKRWLCLWRDLDGRQRSMAFGTGTRGNRAAENYAKQIEAELTLEIDDPSSVT